MLQLIVVSSIGALVGQFLAIGWVYWWALTVDGASGAASSASGERERFIGRRGEKRDGERISISMALR